MLVRACIVSLFGLACLASGADAHNKYAEARTSTQFDPFKYLPAGAKIKDQRRDVVVADLDGDGQQEVVIFYTLGKNPNNYKANVLVLKQDATDYIRLWESTFEGSWEFTDPSGVYDLNRSGKPQIIVYRKIGVSCPGSLEIYEYRDGRIERLTGKWGYKQGHCEAVEVKDLDNDSVPEIIVLGSHGANDDIYRWNGKQYIRSNARFPQHYNAEMGKLLQAVYSHESVPASARVNWTIQAVRIYITQKRYDEAIRLCRDVLKMMDDSSITQPDSVYPGTKGKAAIFKLLGDTYKVAGNLPQAEKQYQQAQRFQDNIK